MVDHGRELHKDRGREVYEMNVMYDMNHATRQKVKAWAKGAGWPEPGISLVPILSALVTAKKLSLICAAIDATIDRLMLLRQRVNDAIDEGSVTGTVLLRERYDEERTKLAALMRLLDAEAPMPSKPKEGQITDDMILRAREYPLENLLPEELRRGRCRCPIHDGKNQMSFSVKNNRGKCWSCGWEGDPIQYLMDHHGKTFIEAVKELN